jgi:hypothetical protein
MRECFTSLCIRAVQNHGSCTRMSGIFTNVSSVFPPSQYSEYHRMICCYSAKHAAAAAFMHSTFRSSTWLSAYHFSVLSAAGINVPWMACTLCHPSVNAQILRSSHNLSWITSIVHCLRSYCVELVLLGRTARICLHAATTLKH